MTQNFCHAKLTFTIFFGRSYQILNVLEFNSARKRMSVIVKNEEGKIFLFSKGADRYVVFSVQ